VRQTSSSRSAPKTTAISSGARPASGSSRILSVIRADKSRNARPPLEGGPKFLRARREKKFREGMCLPISPPTICFRDRSTSLKGRGRCRRCRMRYRRQDIRYLERRAGIILLPLGRVERSPRSKIVGRGYSGRHIPSPKFFLAALEENFGLPQGEGERFAIYRRITRSEIRLVACGTRGREIAVFRRRPARRGSAAPGPTSA